MIKSVITAALTGAMLATSAVTFAEPPAHAPAWGHRSQEAAEHQAIRDTWINMRQTHENREDAKRSAREQYRYERDRARAEQRYERERERIERRHDQRQGRYVRGQRLERVYMNDRYYVNDWRAHRLAEPPAGYRWVNVDNQYLLVSLATGIISNILLGR